MKTPAHDLQTVPVLVSRYYWEPNPPGSAINSLGFRPSDYDRRGELRYSVNPPGPDVPGMEARHRTSRRVEMGTNLAAVVDVLAKLTGDEWLHARYGLSPEPNGRVTIDAYNRKPPRAGGVALVRAQGIVPPASVLSRRTAAPFRFYPASDFFGLFTNEEIDGRWIWKRASYRTEQQRASEAFDALRARLIRMGSTNRRRVAKFVDQLEGDAR